MRIQVRYFASLRERLGKAGEIVDIPGFPSVQDLWARVGCETEGEVLAAVNQEHAPFVRLLHEGDEVAFFPPVTGG
ncbi:MAG: MoaD/ThiS family protein [Acidiferrobacteraceae bacterium]